MVDKSSSWVFSIGGLFAEWVAKDERLVLYPFLCCTARFKMTSVRLLEAAE